MCVCVRVCVCVSMLVCVSDVENDAHLMHNVAVVPDGPTWTQRGRGLQLCESAVAWFKHDKSDVGIRGRCVRVCVCSCVCARVCVCGCVCARVRVHA